MATNPDEEELSSWPGMDTTARTYVCFKCWYPQLEASMDGYQAVMDLAADPQRAQKWLPVVVSAFLQARRAAPYGGRFAGAWVLRDLGDWVPSLRPLAAAGIVEKSGETVRGGKRAYYCMPDADGVERALRELGLFGPQRYRGVDDFINAYAGTLDPELRLLVRRSQPPNFGWDVFAGDEHLATVVLLEGQTGELLQGRLSALRRPKAV